MASSSFAGPGRAASAIFFAVTFLAADFLTVFFLVAGFDAVFVARASE
jgi:hypothetical protein